MARWRVRMVMQVRPWAVQVCLAAWPYPIVWLPKGAIENGPYLLAGMEHITIQLDGAVAGDKQEEFDWELAGEHLAHGEIGTRDAGPGVPPRYTWAALGEGSHDRARDVCDSPG